MAGETKPSSSKSGTDDRRRIWFVGVEASGTAARWYGPFATREDVGLFLSDWADIVGDAFSEASDRAQRREVVLPFQRKLGAHIVEGFVVASARGRRRKGR